MKLLFIFPFIGGISNDPIKFLPTGVPVLIGNLKNIFPNIIFKQIDLEEEIKDKIRFGQIKEEYKKLIGNFEKISNFNPNNKDLKIFNNFFKDVIKIFNLADYDHYLFSHYDFNECGIKANIYFAKYLKSVFNNKKIIFGGIKGVGLLDHEATSFPKLKFIDSFVVGFGEKPLEIILQNIINNKKIEKIYNNLKPPQHVLKNLPDYKSNISLRFFKYSHDDLEKMHHVKIDNKNKNNKKSFMIPYAFSAGCFWGKCAYCGWSFSKDFNLAKKLYHKSINEIIYDLIKLKNIYQTKYFIFFNNNFNFNLDFTKGLLKSMIKNKLDILWTDYFNLAIFNKEMPDLLARAGCYRVDFGTVTFNEKLQKLY